jgi:DNA repair protein RadD
MDPWPHQIAGRAAALAVQPGEAVVISTPTGGGKTWVASEVFEASDCALLLTSRKMLIEQTSRALTAHGVEHGVISPDHPHDPTKRRQLCMVQTLGSRSIKKDKLRLPRADRIIVDEAHMNSGPTVQEIIKRYPDAAVVGLTATPLDIGKPYTRLVTAGTHSELRRCGALVAATCFAPDEPDMHKVKRQASGEFSEGDARAAMKLQHIVGRVIEHFRQINPAEKPSLCFAPGVEESKWLAQQFCAAGIPAAHIDGEEVWVDGRSYPSESGVRDGVTARLKSGDLKVITNRFVLREGIDLPWIEHLILATPFGSVTSYIQVTGRVLRASPKTGKVSATIQDHGGNFHRHGSPNADRVWTLGQTAKQYAEAREASLRKKNEPEPITCPQCSMQRISGPKCPGCGYAHTTRTRIVVQANGTLKEVTGDIYAPIKHDKSPAEVVEKTWLSCYYRAQKAGLKFTQARGLYFKLRGVYPPEGLPMMPKHADDWYRSVAEVPRERLVPYSRTPKPAATDNTKTLFSKGAA